MDVDEPPQAGPSSEITKTNGFHEKAEEEAWPLLYPAAIEGGRSTACALQPGLTARRDIKG